MRRQRHCRGRTIPCTAAPGCGNNSHSVLPQQQSMCTCCRILLLFMKCNIAPQCCLCTAAPPELYTPRCHSLLLCCRSLMLTGVLQHRRISSRLYAVRSRRSPVSIFHSRSAPGAANHVLPPHNALLKMQHRSISSRPHAHAPWCCLSPPAS